MTTYRPSLVGQLKIYTSWRFSLKISSFQFGLGQINVKRNTISNLTGQNIGLHVCMTHVKEKCIWWDRNVPQYLIRPTITAGRDNCFRTWCLSVCPSPLFKIKQNKFQAKTMFTTGETVGLAEWIIDDPCLLFCVLFAKHGYVLKNTLINKIDHYLHDKIMWRQGC